VAFHASVQLLVINSALEKYLIKNGKTMKKCISYLWTSSMLDSGRRVILCNIIVESGILFKLVRLKKMCLSGTYSKVRVGKLLSDMFPSKNGLEEGDFYNFEVRHPLCVDSTTKSFCVLRIQSNTTIFHLVVQ